MGILLERAHRNELQNALLHVLKAVMVAFQHVSSRGNVHGMLVVNAPRQVEHAFDVVLHHGALRRTGLRACQPLQLLLRALARFAGDRRSRQTGFILGNIVVVFAQFFLYHVQLLAQEIITVVVIDLLVHAALNLLLDIADLKLSGENIAHQLNAQLRVDAFQYGLAVVQIVQHICGDQIGQRAGVAFSAHSLPKLRADVLLRRRVSVKQSPRRARPRAHLGGKLHPLPGNLADFGLNHAVEFIGAHHNRAGKPVHKQTKHAVRHLTHLTHLYNGSHRIQIRKLRIFLHAVPLRHDKQPLIRAHGRIQRSDRFLPSGVKVHHRARINHHPSKGYGGNSAFTDGLFFLDLQAYFLQ